MSDITLHSMTNIDAAHRTRVSWQDRLRDTVGTWLRRSRGRRQLARFNAYELRDLGLSRSDASREVAKPFWQG